MGQVLVVLIQPAPGRFAVAGWSPEPFGKETLLPVAAVREIPAEERPDHRIGREAVVQGGSCPGRWPRPAVSRLDAIRAVPSAELAPGLPSLRAARPTSAANTRWTRSTPSGPGSGKYGWRAAAGARPARCRLAGRRSPCRVTGSHSGRVPLPGGTPRRPGCPRCAGLPGVPGRKRPRSQPGGSQEPRQPPGC